MQMLCKPIIINRPKKSHDVPDMETEPKKEMVTTNYAKKLEFTWI
jgi:hypothetical protein